MPKKTVLTKIQSETLGAIKGYIDKNGFSPTLKEIADDLGVNMRAVIDRIEGLRKKGVIRKVPHKKRNLEIIDNYPLNGLIQVPLVGSVGADNMAIIAEQEFERFLQVEEKVTKGHKDVFAVKVEGNSMRDANIENGSFVIAEPIDNPEAHDGDLVIAIIEDKAVVKRLRINRNTLALMPENKSGLYDPIIIGGDRNDYKIVGRVIDTLSFSDEEDEWTIESLVNDNF